MGTVALTGSDLQKINNRILQNKGTGEVGTLTYPNDIASVKTGKNGNAVYAFNETGRQCEYTHRTILGSDDDKFFNSLLAAQKNDPPSFSLLTGEFTKRVGDGKGGVTNVVYKLDGGIISKQVEAKEQLEGDTEQGEAVWHFKFSNADRTIT